MRSFENLDGCLEAYQVFFCPKDLIYQRGDSAETCLMAIWRGDIQAISRRCGITLAHGREFALQVWGFLCGRAIFSLFVLFQVSRHQFLVQVLPGSYVVETCAHNDSREAQVSGTVLVTARPGCRISTTDLVLDARLDVSSAPARIHMRAVNLSHAYDTMTSGVEGSVVQAWWTEIGLGHINPPSGITLGSWRESLDKFRRSFWEKHGMWIAIAGILLLVAALWTFRGWAIARWLCRKRVEHRARSIRRRQVREEEAAAAQARREEHDQRVAAHEQLLLLLGGIQEAANGKRGLSDSGPPLVSLPAGEPADKPLPTLPPPSAPPGSTDRIPASRAGDNRAGHRYESL